MARLKGFQKLTPIKDALGLFMNAQPIKKPCIESVNLDSSLDRILAEPIVAEEDLPEINRSAVDGYALRAAHTLGASQFKPRSFALTNKAEIGEGEARQVWTGNPVPKGADAVVMLENTRQVAGNVEVWVPLTPGENTFKKGEDLRKGEIAVEACTRLRSQQLGLMAALGKCNVKVFKKPKVAILTTGNELIEIGGEKREDQIFDANKHVISAMCREIGADPVDLGIAADDMGEITCRLKKGLEADAIVTTGGSSVGIADLVPDAVNRIGKPGIIVHGIAMRPAMPTALGVVNNKPIVVLSGNPVAAMIGFEVFARPLIFKLSGMKHAEPRPILKAKLLRRIPVALGRRTFVRVRVSEKNGMFIAEPVSAKGSSILTTMTRSNGYIAVPENREGLAKNEIVPVYLFETVRIGESNV